MSEEIEKLKNRSFWMVVIYVIIYIVTLVLLFIYFFSFSGHFFLENIMQNYKFIFFFISKNKEFLLGIFAYFSLLTFIRYKKGLVILKYDDWKISNEGSFIFKIKNILGIYGIVSIPYLAYLLFNHRIFEAILIILTSILGILLMKFLLIFNTIRNNYILITEIGKIDEKYKEDTNKKLEKYSINYFFLILDNFIHFSLFYAFFFIIFGIINHFNIITILFLHFYCVLFYFSFILLSNKFPPKINVSINGKLIKEVYLLEDSKERFIYLDSKGKMVFTKQEKIDFFITNIQK